MKCAPIMVIEDDAELRNLCRMVLEPEGYTVETAVNGQEALELLDRYEEPCLILLDMMMPIMNGHEFMAAFAKRPHVIAPIPVYLVSATASQKYSQEMGCLGFLRKPFDLDALLAIVHVHCKWREISKEVG